MTTENESHLSFETVNTLVRYDPAIGEVRWKTDPGTKKLTGRRAGVKCTATGYVTIKIRGRNVKAHRVAWLLTYGAWPDEMLDHRNLVRDDNRISNLRPATRSQNKNNTNVRSDSASGIKGVRKLDNRWQAYIRVAGRTLFLGSHLTPEAAQAAYSQAAERHFGQYART